MSVDQAFVGAGQKVGLEIWRIEKLKVVAQDKSTYGQFYSGDSYLILHTKQPSNKLEWDLHFWLGKDTSQDEAGVAAYKTVELDDSLGGGPVQYREVQDHESRKFLSYFKQINYLEGGVDSGFKKVQRGVYEKRLFHLKGKRNVKVRQVELTYRSLNNGDVFLLDNGSQLYVWNGSESSRVERMKGMEVARKIRDDERGGKAKIDVIDHDKDLHLEDKFFIDLGDRGEIAEAAEDDVTFEQEAATAVKLYRVSDESGELEIEEIGEKPLKKELLLTEDCYILDAGSSGLFVWVGKNCTKNEKNSAMKNAIDFVDKKGYPKWTQVTRIVEGGETPIFKQYFSNWAEAGAQVGFGKVARTEKIASYANAKFDSTTMYERKTMERKEILPDDGRGDVDIWRVENRDLVPQPREMKGVFYTGDCYVLKYTYMTGTKQNIIIYFWQGSKSTTDEKGGSAILAQRMDDEMGGIATQVRVVQGREPEHFLLIFQGKMVTLLGGINNKEPDSDIRVFQVRGTNKVNTRAAQVVPRASSLNSNDVFIVLTDRQIMLWCGKGASEEEKEVATSVLINLAPQSVGAEVLTIEEGSETDEFWNVLGGREPYATGPRLENNANNVPPRLFQCSNASGSFKVEEILDFCQEDLIEDDVMILDTIDEVYVWLGKGANEIEKKMTLQTAMDYIKNDPTGRNPDNTVILQIKQGFEPPAFTGHFLGWDPDKWSAGKTYEDLKRELGQENVKATTVQEELAMYDKKYPYEELLKATLPKGVDPCKKERYLTDEDFQAVFKMTYKQYSALPKWRQLDCKKRTGLF